MSTSDSLPWLPLYVGDFMRVTSGWTVEECGLFVRLLIYQWDHEWLPTDPDRLARIVGTDRETFERGWPTVRQQFAESDARGLGSEWFNEALANLRAKQMQFRERQRQGGKKGARARWAVPPFVVEGDSDVYR